MKSEELDIDWEWAPACHKLSFHAVLLRKRHAQCKNAYAYHDGVVVFPKETGRAVAVYARRTDGDGPKWWYVARVYVPKSMSEKDAETLRKSMLYLAQMKKGE